MMLQLGGGAFVALLITLALPPGSSARWLCALILLLPILGAFCLGVTLRLPAAAFTRHTIIVSPRLGNGQPRLIPRKAHFLQKSVLGLMVFSSVWSANSGNPAAILQFMTASDARAALRAAGQVPNPRFRIGASVARRALPDLLPILFRTAGIDATGRITLDWQGAPTTVQAGAPTFILSFAAIILVAAGMILAVKAQVILALLSFAASMICIAGEVAVYRRIRYGLEHERYGLSGNVAIILSEGPFGLWTTCDLRAITEQSVITEEIDQLRYAAYARWANNRNSPYTWIIVPVGFRGPSDSVRLRTLIDRALTTQGVRPSFDADHAP